MILSDWKAKYFDHQNVFSPIKAHQKELSKLLSDFSLKELNTYDKLVLKPINLPSGQNVYSIMKSTKQFILKIDTKIITEDYESESMVEYIFDIQDDQLIFKEMVRAG